MRAHTRGPWYWHTDSEGRVSLRTPDRGNLVVMDFVRRGMNAAQPRFAHWRDMEKGAERERFGGILEAGIDHSDAVLIATAPDLFLAARLARDVVREDRRVFYDSHVNLATGRVDEGDFGGAVGASLRTYDEALAALDAAIAQATAA